MKYFSLILIFSLSACVTQNSSTTQPDEVTLEEVVYLQKGNEYLLLNNAEKAIYELNKAINICTERFLNQEKRVYAVRGMTEALYYMLMASSQNKDAIAIDNTCSDALYLKGYAHLELGQIKQAESLVERAIAMAPVNAVYLSEMGHIQQMKQDWKAALNYFELAEKYANSYSPEASKISEVLRAKRGVGYTLIELGDWDKAEAKFNECLVMDSNDQSALREIEYIKSLRNELNE